MGKVRRRRHIGHRAPPPSPTRLLSFGFVVAEQFVPTWARREEEVWKWRKLSWFYFFNHVVILTVVIGVSTTWVTCHRLRWLIHTPCLSLICIPYTHVLVTIYFCWPSKILGFDSPGSFLDQILFWTPWFTLSKPIL